MERNTQAQCSEACPQPPACSGKAPATLLQRALWWSERWRLFLALAGHCDVQCHPSRERLPARSANKENTQNDNHRHTRSERDCVGKQRC